MFRQTEVKEIKFLDTPACVTHYLSLKLKSLV